MPPELSEEKNSRDSSYVKIVLGVIEMGMDFATFLRIPHDETESINGKKVEIRNGSTNLAQLVTC